MATRCSWRKTRARARSSPTRPTSRPARRSSPTPTRCGAWPTSSQGQGADRRRVRPVAFRPRPLHLSPSRRRHAPARTPAGSGGNGCDRLRDGAVGGRLAPAARADERSRRADGPARRRRPRPAARWRPRGAPRERRSGHQAGADRGRRRGRGLERHGACRGYPRRRHGARPRSSLWLARDRLTSTRVESGTLAASEHAIEDACPPRRGPRDRGRAGGRRAGAAPRLERLLVAG